MFTGAVEGGEEAEKEEVEKGEGESAVGQGTEKVEMEMSDGKEVIIPVKDDLSQLALLGQSVSGAFWGGVEGVKRSVWGVVGWA